MNAPPKVDDIYKFGGGQPPEMSARCDWWVDRIRGGWVRNKRISSMGWETAAEYFGVYGWEYLHVLLPLLQELE